MNQWDRRFKIQNYQSVFLQKETIHNLKFKNLKANIKQKQAKNGQN